MKKILFLVLPFIISCSHSEDDFSTNEKDDSKLFFKDKVNNVSLSKEQSNSVSSYQATSQIFINEGDFIRIQSSGVGNYFYVWIYRGTLRHIVSHDTWMGLFNNNRSFKATFSSWQHAISVTNRPMGYTLQPDNDLIRDPLTQKIYLREGSSIVWIKNLNTFNYYRFNSNIVKNIPGGIKESGPGAVYSYGGYIDILE